MSQVLPSALHNITPCTIFFIHRNDACHTPLPNSIYCTIIPWQDDLLAELEELEQADLEKNLLEIGEPSSKLDDSLDRLPAVRKLEKFS